MWEGAAILESRNADGSTTLQRYYDQGFMDSDGTALTYTRDHLGSVRELVDAFGAIRARYDYDPYGRMTKISGDKDSPFLYTGHLWHSYSGLYLTLFREYDANLGRWISRDPAEEGGGGDLYAYTFNDPIDLVDANGLWPTKPYIPIHQDAIQNNLSVFLPEDDIKTLMDQQTVADEDQSMDGSYKHAMRAPWETQGQARKRSNDYVRSEIEMARKLHGEGCEHDAMVHLGNAIHTLQDATSPAHRGFQEWDGEYWSNTFGIAWHILRETSFPDFNWTTGSSDATSGTALDEATQQGYMYYEDLMPMPSNFFKN